MSKDTPSQPAAPDPAVTARAQGAANKETAIAQARLNRVNEYTPFGQSVYEPTGQMQGDIEEFKRTTTLSPAQQALLEQQQGISSDLSSLAGAQVGRIESAVSDPFSFAGLPNAPVANEAQRNEVENSIYNRYKSRLDPRFAEEEASLMDRLASQGITMGSEAYNKEVDRFGRGKTDAYQAAQDAAIQGGGAEQSRMFGLEGAARERGIQERAYERDRPLNELAAFMGASPGITIPQFSPIPQTSVAPTDVLGAYALNNAAQQNVYSQQMGARNAAMGGLYGLGSAALGGFSYGAGRSFFPGR